MNFQATKKSVMPGKILSMASRKRIALIAHDNRKADLVEWCSHNRGTLARHELYATGTTGAILQESLGLDITRFLSGPLGGDQQVGASIVEGRIDIVLFFSDPLEPHPHDVDVKALLRIAVVYNVPIACNRSTADFLLSSPLMAQEYRRIAMCGDDFTGPISTAADEVAFVRFPRNEAEHREAAPVAG